jgi:Tat protein translocase TatB subunit
LSLIEILIIAAVALIVIGPEQLPDALRGMGKILRELRSASNEVMRELTDALDEEPRRQAVPPRTEAENPKPSEPVPPSSET